MECSHQTMVTSRDHQKWRRRLDSEVVDYCARNNVSQKEAVDSLIAFLRSAPTSRERLSRAELRHRMRNEMQFLISSMRQRRRARGPEKGDGCSSCIGQVAGLARFNDTLDGDDPARRVDLGAHCAQITVDMRKALHLDDKIRLEVEADPILVPAELARNIVLILNEALTNAIKHAFGDHGGTVRVRLTHKSSREAELTVTDDGCGSATSGDRGSGGSLIDALAAQISGRIHRARTSTGFRLSCRFPVRVV